MASDPKRSIKPWIPQTAQNDPDKFPLYEYAAYPRMMTKLCTEADLKDWLENNSFTGDNGKVAYKGNRPRVGSPIPVLDAARQPIVVNSEAEEREFLKNHPAEAGVVRIDTPSLSNVTAMAEKQAEIDDLKAQLAKPKRGRPPKSDIPANLPPA